MTGQATELHATAAETEAALKQLSEADLVRLKRLIKNRIYGLMGVEWSDVLHEAIARALGGSRPWPKNVPLIAFLSQVSRSLVSELWKQNDRRLKAGILTEADTQSDAEDSTLVGTIDNTADVTRNPSTEHLAGAVLAEIEALFDDDPIAWGVVTARAEGMTPVQAQQELEITPTQYASALKKIRRRLGSTHAHEDI